jgi:hypothetical protein
LACKPTALRSLASVKIQHVLAAPAWRGGRLSAVDHRALLPLKWQRIISYGTFAFNMNEHLPPETVVAARGLLYLNYELRYVKAMQVDKM